MLILDEKIQNKKEIDYPGIYKIECTISGKCYIGSASKSVLSRFRDHKLLLNKGVHFNRKLNNYYKKYKDRVLKFTVLELITQDIDVLERESFFIKNLKPYFNICKIPTNSRLGVKASIKTKKLMSKTRKGFDSANRIKAREKVLQKKKLNGDFVKITAINIKTKEEFNFDSISECCRVLNLKHSCVSRVCRNVQNRSQHKGWSFRTEKYGSSLPIKTPKYISEIKPKGWSVVINKTYIGYRTSMEDAIKLRNDSLSRFFDEQRCFDIINNKSSTGE